MADKTKAASVACAKTQGTLTGPSHGFNAGEGGINVR